MNVYEKLQKARVELQARNIKQTGENKFAKYKYFELGDFLPHVNAIFNEQKLFSQVSFTSEVATLTIVNAEKPDEQVVFTSPMAEADLKGVHAIQNLGAVQTYQRRYLYMAALEISEHDALDGTTGRESTGQQRPQSQPQRPQATQNNNGNGSGAVKPDGGNDALEKGRKAYFAEMNGKLPEIFGKDAARNYAVWMASGMLGRELESFNDIPLDALRRIFAHVKKHDAGHLAGEYEVMERERMGPDDVPGFEDQEAPVEQEALI